MPAIPATGFVYILHFDVPLAHAQHYVGSTGELVDRLTDHANGQGARLTEVLKEKHIQWKLAAIYRPTKWSEKTIRQHERHVKNNKNTWRHCPLCCKGDHVAPDCMEEYPLPNLDSLTLRKA